jgi:hypothetical protein
MLSLSKQSIALITVILRKDRCNHKHLRGSLKLARFNEIESVEMRKNVGAYR